MRLAFDAPVTADRLVVTPCSASPSARYDVEVNGSLAGTVEPNGAAAELQLGAGGAGWRVADVELRLARSQPGTCVGEVSIVSHGAPLPLRPPRVVLAGVRASSVLSPALAHHPNLLFDHRLGFGWAVGRGGDGVGESVELTFKEPFGLLGAELWNGDQASPARFSASSSVRTLSVGVDNAPQINVPVDDVEGPQRLRLPRMAVGRTVKLAVLETRPGGSRRDLVLSELRLIDLLGPVGVVVAAQDARGAGEIPGVAGAAFARSVDAQLRSVCGGRTIAFRSDLGFESQTHGLDVRRTVGDWSSAGGAGPWLTLTVDGMESVRTSGWVEPEDHVGGKPLVGDGRVEVARVEALGREAFESELGRFRRTDRALAACISDAALGEGIDAFDLMVKRDALLIRGALGTDLLTE